MADSASAGSWRDRIVEFYYSWVVPDFADHELPGEVVRYGERRHVIWLLAETWVALIVGGLALLGLTAAEDTGVQAVLAFVYLAATLYYVYKLIEWSVTRFYVTNYRLVELAGFLDLRLNQIPRNRLTDIQLRQSLLGKIFGYGTIRVETAGQEQALGVIEYVRLPAVLTQELLVNSLTP